MMYGLKNEVIDNILSVLAKYSGIKKCKIIGSRAKGNYKPGSDIDLVLYGDISYNNLLNLHNELDDLFLPYLFDI